jgi:hypothetical protein
MRWLAPEADAVQALTRPPAECLAWPADEEERVLAGIGRLAFRTPVLLGGQAARAGLSCDSCHRNGRGNPDFTFPGVSGAPGTADVTSSLFSTHRGNGVDDPRPIPDLGGPKAKLKVSQAPRDPALERFIRGLVVEEFDGPEPPPRVLRALAAYVRAQDPARCGQSRAERPEDLLDDARTALGLAVREDDRATTLVLISAARARLGLLDERYPDPGSGPLQARIRDLDRRLAADAAAVRAGAPKARAGIARTRQALGRLRGPLLAAEPRSLFNPQRLAQVAKRRLPGPAS